jgi:catechol 2,3-dioxygenase-like lactoylglutathione lyase family enzyme
MIESVQVESVSVPVSDQEQAKKFYVNTLGFELLVDYTWREGMLWSEVAPQNSATSLMLVTWSACMLPSMYRVIVLATEDIQAIHQGHRLRATAYRDAPRDASDVPRPRWQCPLALGACGTKGRGCGI